MTIRYTSCVLLLWLFLACAGRADDFFETKIRPVLSERCFKCHGAKQQKGGIRLDGPEFLKAPSDGSGPLVIPGKPEESRLIRAVRHEGDYPMPPGGKKIPEGTILDLAEWVKAGAKWPRQNVGASDGGKKHWAFQLVRSPPEPEVKAGDWPTSPLDRFVLARLEAKELTPSPPADRRTLLRRLTFDLTGLPPTPEDLDAFVKDTSPEALPKLVDRLLAAREFGERWGRHWLDVARYSDSRGGEDGKYPFAYTYRDWVVRAFNEDLPYDQFLIKQVAADLLTRTENHPDLAALGFLTLGRKFDGNDPDVIDDQLDVLFRGTQGLTLSCARCHDHKYDPIPIRDYYSLYGVFANTREREVPLIGNQEERVKFLAYSAELRARTRSALRFEEVERRQLLGNHPVQVERYLLAARSGEEGAKQGEKREDGLSQVIVNRYREFFENTKAEHHPVMTPWHAFAGLEPAEFASKGKALAREFAANEGEKKLNPLIARLFAGKPPADLEEVARRYGKLFATVARKWERVVAAADKADVARPAQLEDESEDEILQLVLGSDAPLNVSQDDFRELLAEEKQQKFDELRQAVTTWQNGPEAPPHARILVEPDDFEPSKVFIRGKPDQQGDEVPRQFLAVLAGPGRAPFRDGSGRLELARSIASKENPLTARVWANRVWGKLLGQPLVETSSDFGRRGVPPTHPELLDWLADNLVSNGWSTKKLIREIVLSRTYQQASADRPAARALDPANALLWRMNRKRLEVEPLRDALLAVAGGLDLTPGGRPVDLGEQPLSKRRSLYLRVDRGSLPGLLGVFDFANPDLHSPGRHETIVPQQALFLLNSPFVAEQARGLARRVETTKPVDATQWVRGAYRIALGREPTAAESALGVKFLVAAAALKRTGPQPPTQPWKHGHGKWDAKGKRLTGFTRFPHFQDDSWRAGAEYPHPVLNYLALNAEGGHPGENRDQVVVRRWVAPAAGLVRITGVLAHKLPEGEKPEDADGVVGRIVTADRVHAEVDVFNREAKTEVTALAVKVGDAIDFVVDPKANNGNDSFTWKVSLTLTRTGREGEEIGFDSAEDFRGPPPEAPPLNAKEKFAQVLLMSNEFPYLD